MTPILAEKSYVPPYKPDTVETVLDILVEEKASTNTKPNPVLPELVNVDGKELEVDNSSNKNKLAEESNITPSSLTEKNIQLDVTANAEPVFREITEEVSPSSNFEEVQDPKAPPGSAQYLKEQQDELLMRQREHQVKREEYRKNYRENLEQAEDGYVDMPAYTDGYTDDELLEIDIAVLEERIEEELDMMEMGINGNLQ